MKSRGATLFGRFHNPKPFPTHPTSVWRMPSFLLRFEEAVETFNSTYDEVEGLVETWKVCKKVANYLERGERLENIAKRLGYLQFRRDKTNNGRSSAKVVSKRQHLVSTDRQNLEQQNMGNVDMSTSTFHGRRTRDGSNTKANAAKNLSILTFRNLDIKTNTSIQSIRMRGTFKSFGPVSILCPSRADGRPIVQVSLSPIEGDKTQIRPRFGENVESKQTSLHGSTFYEADDYEINDHPHDHDPNELFILPTPPPFVQFPLSSVPEEDDNEVEEKIETPIQSNPILFVNPFASTSVDKPEQLPSPPQTPSTTPNGYVGYEHVPPHLEHDAKPEDSIYDVDPINLTGRIKKLHDAPVAMGGSSDVFYAEWKLCDPRKVAIKVLRTTSVTCVSTVQRRLQREMTLWWKLRHRNIVPLWGYASDFGNLDAMVSPWMKNGSATSYIKTNKCSWSQRMKLFSDVAAGIKYLHNCQPPIIHGDLKPTNVLISNEGDACLCDFGLARIINVNGAPSGFTTSNFAGSIRYMAPELLDPEDDNEEVLPRVNEMSDIYALGCVGLEILTDQIPYANRNLDAQVMHDIIRGTLPSSKPAIFKSINKESHTKSWGLITSTWQRDPLRRPDIVTLSRLIAECRTHQGPQLFAKLDGRDRSIASVSASPLSRSISLSRSTTSVRSETSSIVPYRTRSMGLSRSNPGTPRPSTGHLQVGNSDGTATLAARQRPRSFIIASSSSSSITATPNALYATGQFTNPSIPTSTSLPSLPLPVSITITSEDSTLSRLPQKLPLGGIEEEDTDNGGTSDDDGDGGDQKPNGSNNKSRVGNRSAKLIGLRRLQSLQDLSVLSSSKLSVKSASGLTSTRASSTSNLELPLATPRSRTFPASKPTRKVSETSFGMTVGKSVSKAEANPFNPTYSFTSLHPFSALPLSNLPDSSGSIALRRSLSASWKSSVARRSSSHQRSGSTGSFQLSTTAHDQVWHDQ